MTFYMTKDNDSGMFWKIISVYKEAGFLDVLRKTKDHFSPPKANCFKICRDIIVGKSGLEIGGPSYLFAPKGLLPFYPIIKALDNCNFSNSTMWEGSIEEGLTFKFDDKHPKGYQYISEASELKKIPSDKYDFLLSSHVIEHTANPLKALKEWIRVLKQNGTLIIIIPHKDGTFDHNRNITSLVHIIEDYNNNTPETDLTHLEEILEKHNLKRDPEAGTYEQFKNRSLQNFENRSLHHHVFNTYTAVKLIDHVKMNILAVEACLPFHIIIAAQKSDSYDNTAIINKIQNKELPSPFYSDNY